MNYKELSIEERATQQIGLSHSLSLRAKAEMLKEDIEKGGKAVSTSRSPWPFLNGLYA